MSTIDIVIAAIVWALVGTALYFGNRYEKKVMEGENDPQLIAANREYAKKMAELQALIK